MRITALLGLAGLILAMIVTVAPKASVTTNLASAEITGIDILGLTRNAGDLPAQQYAAH
jgi:hypothetical protein